MAGGNGESSTPKGWLEARTERRAAAGTVANEVGEEHYRDLFNYASDPIFCVDAQTLCFVDLNQTACDVLGYARAELLGKHVSVIDAGVDEVELKRYVRQLDELGAAILISRHRRRDGTEFPVEIRSQSRESNGRIVYDSISRDLTERMALEEARRMTELAFRSAGSMAKVGAWTLDLQTGETFFSDEVCRIYGLAPGTNLPAEDGILYYPEDVRPEITAAVEEAIAEGTAYDLEIPFVNKQGERLWVRTIGHADYDDSGKPVRLFGAIQDVTRGRVAELLRQALASIRLRASLLSGEDDLSSVLEAFCAALSQLRVPVRQCVWVVEGSTGMMPMGHSSSERGQWMRCGVDVDVAGRLADAIRAASPAKDDGGRGVETTREAHQSTFVCGAIALRLIARKGEQFDEAEVSIVEQMLEEVDGANARLLERKTALDRDAQLQQAQRMESVGRLAGGIAHDFNNLLTVILGTCGLSLMQDGVLSADDVSVIEDAAVRARGLTQQLLAFSRQQHLQPRVISVNAAVKQLSRMLSRLLGEDLSVVVKVTAKLDTVFVDPSQLDQVLINLAVNARDAMVGGGTLTIETADEVWSEASNGSPPELPDGRYVRLSVTDTGQGIEKGVLTHIFEPFFTTKQGGGTGLGLATVHGIVTQSGGYVDVRTKVGDGTTFDIFLPHSTGRQRTEQPRRHPRHRGQERVLVVEDQEPVRALVCTILRGAGYVVYDESGATSARSRVEQATSPFELVVTDVVLADGSGLDVVRSVRERFGRVPALFVSGYANHALLEQALSMEGSTFLQKPFGVSDLLDQVRETLAQQEADES